MFKELSFKEKADHLADMIYDYEYCMIFKEVDILNHIDGVRYNYRYFSKEIQDMMESLMKETLSQYLPRGKEGIFDNYEFNLEDYGIYEEE